MKSNQAQGLKSRGFGWVGRLDQAPDRYRALDAREAIKVLIRF